MTTKAQEVREALTVDKFRAWLQTKPPEGRFEYVHNQNCAVAQFLKETGVFPPGQDTSDDFGVVANYVRVGDRFTWADQTNVPIPQDIDLAARAYTQTYGAVLAALG